MSEQPTPEVAPAVGPVIRVRGLTKAFPGVQALSAVDFDVVPGEVHALVGENGAGKSTLIKILAGVHPQDDGTVEITGSEVHITSPHQATALGLGFIHQDLNVVPGFSSYENMTLGLNNRRIAGVLVDWRDMRRRVRAMAERLQLDFDLGVPMRSLSQAQAQLVAIGRVLMLDARVVTMDEPTAALSGAEVLKLYEVIRDLTSHGVSVVYVSHRLEEVFELADRITVLKDGEKVGTFQRGEIRDKRHLASLIIGHEARNWVKDVADDRGEVRLEATHLTWGRAVRDASLTLHAGEIVGLGGLVGAGRSELAHLLFGAEKPDAGEIVVKGKRLVAAPKAGIRAGIALLPEDRRHQAAVPTMTVRENATLSSLLRYLTGPFIHRPRERKSVMDMVRALDIKVANIDRPMRNLSGGNQQKVVIGKWIDTGADVYIFDEPTQGVDVGAKAEIHRIIQQLAHDGAAVLFISSDLEEVTGIAHRVLVMREGSIVAELDGLEATPERILEHCYAAHATHAT